MPKVVPEYKEEAKAKIVKAARVVFAKKGYHDATMDDVAREVGVSKGALYSYFRSKEDFLKEISLEVHLTLRKTLSEASKTSNLQEAIEHVYSTIIEKYRGNLHTHFEIISLASHDVRIRNIVFKNYQKDVQAAETFVEQQKKNGAIQEDADAHLLAELFTALYLGMIAKLLIGYPDEQVHDQWVKSVLLILRETRAH